jgi:hypothetical protein
MRWRSSAISVLAAVAMTAKLRVMVPSGQRKPYQRPAKAIGCPSCRAMA